ncbi:Hypothetical protein, putative [Bodo saltans]|uniref:Uncharacterized protein n=1 Tax=Bodo saltans TaxID=75058 RepID=A0A0S4JFQ9_BODSA|nr:Hypothetical protein, putative [Bodo saltans]|eukprot:CUG89300.1 Hypothetical protein, putative [Bodo saltans]
MVGLVVRTEGGVYTTTHLLLLQLKYLDNTPFSVHDEWRELYKMGSTDVRALVADCVAMLEHHPWDDAMAPIHVAKNVAEQCQNNCDFKTPSGREEVFAAICRDHGATSVRILSPYEAALQKYVHDGDVSVRGLAAKFLSDQWQVVGKPQKCTIAIAFGFPKEEVGDDFVVGVYKIMVQDDTTIEQKFDDIVKEHAAYKAAAARDGVPFSFPQLREGDLQLDRFLVVYRYIESDEVPPQRNVGVDRSAHVLVIDSFNKLAAFYPTAWENETFKPGTSVREVVS